MTTGSNICSLDYLIGTLATAYKGIITSLIVKDFCMEERDGSIVLRGTILSMPEGNYQASLIHEGIELFRGGIREGYFELKSDSELIKNGNLQIDIIQNGRHIGTFLLKKETTAGFFISALELSQDIKDVNFKVLTGYLQDKIGLLKNAEDIISKIVSTKKDWGKLSEGIKSFSKDLFWFHREAYYAWHSVLVRWSLNACTRAEKEAEDRAISNLLFLMELPLEKESDMKRLQFLVDAWLRVIKDSTIDLSSRLNRSLRVFSEIHKKFSGMDIRPALKVLLYSLKQRVVKTPAVSDSIIDKMKGFITDDDLARLSAYSERRRKDMLLTIVNAGDLLDKEEYSEIPNAFGIKIMGGVESWQLDDRKMIDLFYAILEKNITGKSGERLSEVLFELFLIFSLLSPDAHRRAMLNTARLIRKLISLDMIDICESLLMNIEMNIPVLKEDIVLDSGVALSILKAGSDRLIKRYKGILKQILIPAPKVTGFSNETWAEIINPLHLERLSRFLAVIKLDDVHFRDVLVHVICNLYVSGVFIPDNRLFHREISDYLNSNTIRNNFLLNYMLLKKLPAYYNEIGASGRIRDDTSEIDSWGNDAVLYFLRKQVHANASNYNIYLVEEIIGSWVYKNPELLKGVVPEDVFNKLNVELLGQYSSAINPLFESLGILDAGGLYLKKILAVSEEGIKQRLRDLNTSDEIRSKVLLICRIYREIVGKYFLISRNVETEDITFSPQQVSENLSKSINRVKQLKEIIISPEKTIPKESLYFKRHIAFGIPSVLGSYHEPKFDAFGETLRNEERIKVIFEEIISGIEHMGRDFSMADIMQWIHCLDVMNELLKVHDLGNFQVDEAIMILKTNKLYLSQVVDMLRIWQRELTWIVDFLNKTFHMPLVEILRIFPKDELSGYVKGLHPEEKDFINKAADVIIRDMVNSITGLVELDRLLDNLIKTLNFRIESGSDEEFTLSEKSETDSETDKDYFMLDELSDEDAMRLAPLIGGKAKNLAYLYNKGLLIPYGVVFSSERTRDYLQYTGSENFKSLLRRAVKEIEDRTGALFGDKERPLFVSVRSGSYISMPGILSSILYCGMNKEIVKALTENTDNRWFAWDSYRRFIEHYATVVYGLDMKVFEEIINNLMQNRGMAKREDLKTEQMEEIVNLFLSELTKLNKSIPEDVYEQLKESVKAIYRSWYSERAIQFRKAMRVSEHWGTAVTIMQMIHGNDRDSGASVFFTRKPFSLENGIYGETKEKALGGELVYGRFVNRPLTKQQALNGQKSLEEVDPQLFLMHQELAERIEKAMRGLPQEVESTYTTGDSLRRKRHDGERIIYVLQTRRMEFHRGFTVRFDDVCKMESNIIGCGIGVHGSALSGVATFSSSPEYIKKLREDVKLPVLLLRKEASTNDVSLMPVIDGIITATGGATSHAAILAQKFDLTAVVGCSDMKIEADEKGELSAGIGTYIVKEGTFISIDGSTGIVYSGLCTITVPMEH